MKPYLQARLIGFVLCTVLIVAYVQLPKVTSHDNPVQQATERLSANPRDPAAYKLRAQTYLHQGKTEQARSDVLAALGQLRSLS